MTDYMPGGQRRIDRVLDPSFIEGLDALPLEEIRVRRAEADQEEVDLSFARRLLQGRLDLLRDERACRDRDGAGPRAPRTDAELAAALGRVLGDQGVRSTRGLGRHLTAEPTRLGEHRREAERAVADLEASDLPNLDDAQLDEKIARLGALEQRVSASRRGVQQVADRLGAEIARRYQTGEVEVSPVG